MVQQLVSFGAWVEIIAAVVLFIVSLTLQYLPAPGLWRVRRVRSLRQQSWYMRGLYLLGAGVMSVDMIFDGVLTLHQTYSPWIPFGTLVATAILFVWLLRGGGLLRP